jgi:hypothetical protein
MIGSPASRGAVVSVGAAAGRAKALDVSADIAANVMMAGTLQRRIAVVDRAVINRIAMPCSA